MWGRAASPRPAGQGVLPPGTALLVDVSDPSLDVGVKGLGLYHVINRPGGLEEVGWPVPSSCQPSVLLT